MKNRIAAAIVLALIFGVAPPGEPTTPQGEVDPAENLGAVWNLTLQPCNGGGGNAMKRHPEETKIIESGEMSLDDLGLEFTVPQLFDVERTVLKLFLGDRTRGVVDNYILISDNDLEPPFAAIVVTELPEPMQNQAEAFKAVNILEGQLGTAAGIKPVLEKVSSLFGEALELIVKNRVGTHCFPTSNFQVVPDGSDPPTLGISRFVMIDKYLVEFSLIVVAPPGKSEAETMAFARQSMDGFLLSLRAS